MDLVIIVVKIWLDDPHFNYRPNSNLKQYMKVEEFLVKEITFGLNNITFKKNCKLMMIDFVVLGHVCVGVWFR
jgi:hypothetical protein